MHLDHVNRRCPWSLFSQQQACNKNKLIYKLLLFSIHYQFCLVFQCGSYNVTMVTLLSISIIIFHPAFSDWYLILNGSHHGSENCPCSHCDATPCTIKNMSWNCQKNVSEYLQKRLAIQHFHKSLKV